ncbi:unnamed protein product [Amoebophrya sp. A25]|nr:unnamed protein product [Amoebophrya sp. A25]|eukprot:GSA25T00023269001.1
MLVSLFSSGEGWTSVWSQIPGYILIPCSIILGAWLLFLFLWLQIDRPDKLAGYQEPSDFTFPRAASLLFGVTGVENRNAEQQPPASNAFKVAMLMGLVFLFLVVSFLAATEADRAQGGLLYFLYTTTLLTLVLGVLAFALWGHASPVRNEYLGGMAALVFFTVVSAYSVGTFNFYINVSPFLQQGLGRHYIHVQPTADAVSYLDAGRIDFAPMSRVLVDATVGFKMNGDVYCSAPIEDPNFLTATIQFFAVGKNCCNHEGTFQCAPSTGDMGGNVLVSPVTGEDAGFFYKLVVNLRELITQGARFKTDKDIYKTQAQAIGTVLQRTVSPDAIFVELDDTAPRPIATDMAALKSETFGNYLQPDATLNSTVSPLWFLTKAGGNAFNILVSDEVSDSLKYFGRKADGTLGMKAKDGGTGTERWRVDRNVGPGAWQLVSSGEYLVRDASGGADVVAGLSPTAPVLDPQWTLLPSAAASSKDLTRPHSPYLDEMEPGLRLFSGPFFLYGSLAAVGVWILAGFFYLLFLLIVLAALRV